MHARKRIVISPNQVIILLSILVAVLILVIVLLLLRPSSFTPAKAPATSPPATLTILPSPTAAFSPEIPTGTPTEAFTATPLPVCDWLPFSDVTQVPQVYPPDCFSGLLDLGFGEQDGILLFYKTIQRRRGLYGMMKLVGSDDDILVRVDVKKLIAGRFLVAISPSLTPNDSSIGLRIQSEDGKAFFVKVVYFMPGGYEKELSASPSDPNWGQTYNVNFKVVGSKVKVIVNKATLVQWEINFDKRFLFVGYQALPMEKASTSLDVSVEFP
jgi:hypothetical protein